MSCKNNPKNKEERISFQLYLDLVTKMKDYP